MIYVLAVDPGGRTTGIVLFLVMDDEPAKVVDSWGIDGSVKSLIEWWENERPIEDFVLVCEQFVQWGRDGVELSPMRIEGALEVLRAQDYANVVFQPAGGKNTAVPDAALGRLGITKKSFPGDHHHDRYEAARHGLWYLKRMRHMPTIKKAFPND